jgi:hypothetical protein
MSATVHPREHGVTLRCNYADCSATHTTALIGVRRNRKAAASAGWIRGLDKARARPRPGGGRPPNRRWDICPEHAVEERRRADERKRVAAERRAARDAKRKERDALLKPAKAA